MDKLWSSTESQTYGTTLTFTCLLKTKCFMKLKKTEWRLYAFVTKKDSGMFSRLLQTSADKNSESPDSSVLSLSGRTDRQTADRVFLRNPDKTRTADRIETDKIRIDRHLTENPDRIQTADRHWTGFSGKSGQNETRTVLSADV